LGNPNLKPYEYDPESDFNKKMRSSDTRLTVIEQARLEQYDREKRRAMRRG